MTEEHLFDPAVLDDLARPNPSLARATEAPGPAASPAPDIEHGPTRVIGPPASVRALSAADGDWARYGETKVVGPPPDAQLSGWAPTSPDVAVARASTAVPRTRKWRSVLYALSAAAVAVLGAFLGLAWEHHVLAEAVEAHLVVADERIATGRLAGPSGDEALDHLLAARTLKADDVRVTERLNALADTFEQLGERALMRGELAEAAVHFQGAVLAEPSRELAGQRLQEVERRVRSVSELRRLR